MSVKLIDNDAFYGYRVRRTVAGTLYQEYFSLKSKGKRLTGRAMRSVEIKAERRDRELQELQEKHRKKSRESRCFHPDGTVRGISYLLKTEKSGSLTPIFQVGIASELERKTICTSYSLNAHGTEGAWRKAVEAYCKHKQISKNSRLFQKLQKAMPKVEQG